MSNPPGPGPGVVEGLTTGSLERRSLGTAFPAERLRTQMTWDDVALPPQTRHQIRKIENWVKDDSGPTQDRGVGKRAEAGYRVLFHGRAGTDKTLTAALLGKATGRPVVRIDLSRVVSTYIGETEKNLSRFFDEARDQEWILLFDEADALFGKHTAVRDAHDKYANQEVAYLLRAIESHPGLVILATNQRDDIDDAVLRQCRASVHFLPSRAGDP